MSTTGTRAITALRRADIAHELHPYAPLGLRKARVGDRPSYGLDAATALGVDPATVCKTLVVVADGAILLAVVPSNRTLDLKRLAAVVGAHRAAMAEPRDAERATGYLIGGISPIATARHLRVILDASAVALDRIYVSAGQRGLQVSLRPGDLVDVVGATVATVSIE